MPVQMSVYNATLMNLNYLEDALARMRAYAGIVARTGPPSDSIVAAAACALRDLENAHENVRQVWNDYIVPNSPGSEPWPPA